MRYREITEEVRIANTGKLSRQVALTQRVAELKRDEAELAAIRPIMYGYGALDAELDIEKLTAARLANEKQRLEIMRLRSKIGTGDALDAALALAKIQQVEAEAAATLIGL